MLRTIALLQGAEESHLEIVPPVMEQDIERVTFKNSPPTIIEQSNRATVLTFPRLSDTELVVEAARIKDKLKEIGSRVIVLDGGKPTWLEGRNSGTFQTISPAND